jgi:ArsR family transcriptional regulator, arsenate/arsenite/antimonite-responsive transcriptional repressor
MPVEPIDMFKALSVDTRLKILDLLKSRGPLGVNRIAERIGVTPAAVSQHLKILRLAGLVRSQRMGYRIPYAINAPVLEHCRLLLNEICSLRPKIAAAPAASSPRKKKSGAVPKSGHPRSGRRRGGKT